MKGVETHSWLRGEADKQVKRRKVTSEVKRSCQYWALKFGLPEETVVEDGDDQETVSKATSARQFDEVSDTTAKGLEHVLMQEGP